jgi:hypothetical protein
MAFGKGRNSEQVFIEESLVNFQRILYEIPRYWKEMDLSIWNKFQEIAKKESDGDVEVESDILRSLYNGIDSYGELCSCFYEALILATYSFYERMLKMIVKRIVKRNGVERFAAGSTKRQSYVKSSIKSIKQHLGVKNFDDDIEKKITDIDTIYRTRRNYIAHGVYEGFCRIEDTFIEELLQKITSVLVYINEIVENRLFPVVRQSLQASR